MLPETEIDTFCLKKKLEKDYQKTGAGLRSEMRKAVAAAASDRARSFASTEAAVSLLSFRRATS